MAPSTSTSTSVSLSFQSGEYTGPVNENNEPHGKGTIIYPYTKHKYEGEFVNGKAHGKGVASGLLTVEICQVINNELRDIGDQYVVVANGTTLSSPTAVGNGSFSGQPSSPVDVASGNTTWSYDGEWKEGEMCGQGTFNFVNGDMFSGEWKDGAANGQGYYVWKSTGDKYMGEFANMKRHGSGTMMFLNGHKFDGTFYCDYRHGYGVETYANGNRYEGYWVMDKRHGQGFAYVKLDNLDKKLQKKRKQNVKGQSIPANSAVKSGAQSLLLNTSSIDQYLVMLQEYQFGKLVNEKELLPNEYAPYLTESGALKPPKELQSKEQSEFDHVLLGIDEEIELLISEQQQQQQTNATGSATTPIDEAGPRESLSGNSLNEVASNNAVLSTENVFVQGVVTWTDIYWDMIQEQFVTQYTLKCELDHTKRLLADLDQLGELEDRKTFLLEKIDIADNAKSKTKWEMKRVIVEELNQEAPNEYSDVGLFLDKLDELIGEMRMELSDIENMKDNASNNRDEKKIVQTKQQLSDIEKKIFRLESAIQTAKNSGGSGSKLAKQYKDNLNYLQLLEEVTIHLQRLRVLLRRIMRIKYHPQESVGSLVEEKNLVSMVHGLFESNMIRSREVIQKELKGIEVDVVIKRCKALADFVLQQQ